MTVNIYGTGLTHVTYAIHFVVTWLKRGYKRTVLKISSDMLIARSGVSLFRWLSVEVVWHGFREAGIYVGRDKTGILESQVPVP